MAPAVQCRIVCKSNRRLNRCSHLSRTLVGSVEVRTRAVVATSSVDGPSRPGRPPGLWCCLVAVVTTNARQRRLDPRDGRPPIRTARLHCLIATSKLRSSSVRCRSVLRLIRHGTNPVLQFSWCHSTSVASPPVLYLYKNCFVSSRKSRRPRGTGSEPTLRFMPAARSHLEARDTAGARCLQHAPSKSYHRPSAMMGDSFERGACTATCTGPKERRAKQARATCSSWVCVRECPEGRSLTQSAACPATH